MLDKSKLEIGVLLQNKCLGIYGWIKSFTDKEIILENLEWITKPKTNLFLKSNAITYTPSTPNAIYGDKFKFLVEDNWEVIEFNTNFKPDYLLK